MFFRVTSYTITKRGIGNFDRRTVYKYTFVEVVDLFCQFYGMCWSICFWSKGRLMLGFVSS